MNLFVTILDLNRLRIKSNMENDNSHDKKESNIDESGGEQTMSMTDEIHEIHSMLKSMTAEHKKEEPKAESMNHEEDTKKKVDSTAGTDNKKPSYSFAWPEKQKESNLLCDLVS